MRTKKHLQRSMFCQWSDHKFSANLKSISSILDEHPEFCDWVFNDLSGGKKDIGVGGMSAEQVLRSAILKQQNGWSYEFLELQLVDSSMTQSFIRLDEGESYSKSTLQANISKIRAETWQKMNIGVVKYANAKGVENGKKVRIDATVIESNIHDPSDSSLLYDCIRVANRVFRKFRQEYCERYYPKATAKRAKKLTLQIINAGCRKKRVKLYKTLIDEAKKLQNQLPFAITRFKSLSNGNLARQISDLERVLEYLPLILDQTIRRVLKEEKVPSHEKILSIFEPHSDVIVKGKRDLAYGHKVFLTGTESGLITDCQLVQGNPSDTDFFIPMIENHKEIFGYAPRQTTADGGFASEENLYDAKDLGVKDVCFSKHMGLEIEEMCKSRWVFQKLRNFRAGIESLISCLKRAFGLTRATWKNVTGFASYVHSSIFSYNLTLLAKLT